MSFTLVAVTGPLAGQRFALDQEETWVGRAGDVNRIVIDQPDISRRHARVLATKAGGVEIEDHSTNGTFVDGQRIQGKIALQAGCRLRFGSGTDAEFELRRAQAASAPRSAAPAPAPAAAAAPPTVAPASAAGCWLEIVEPQQAVRPWRLDTPRLELSRAEGPGRLVLRHPTVSAPHAEIIVTPHGEALLRDLKSSNGTYVNGERVQERHLAEGDLIQLGSCEIPLLLFREAQPRTLRLTDFDLSQPRISIGRDPSNNLRLDHPTVSQFHAEIHNLRGRITVTDLGSTNGTFVNGEAAQAGHALHPGDRLSLGAAQFVFDGSHLEGQAEAGRAALTAAGLSVEVRDRGTGRAKLLLDDISMLVEPCQFVGLLGGSGAGKSTLMDALNGSRPASRGRVLINQSDLYREFAAVRSLIGYVPQDDILHAQLTAGECLYYSARLRLPDDYSETALRERVAEVIHVLELGEQARQPIHSLSGGQRKRVSVGIELLSNPSLLFLDEPTAGQDPKNELQMMQLFRRIANQGASVIINTHLLGSFGLFDRVAVLVGGKMAFYGPAPEMLEYFGCGEPHEIYYRLKEDNSPEQWGRQFRDSSFFPRYAGGGSPPPSAAAPAPASSAKPKHSTRRQLSTVWSRQLTLKLKDKSNLAMLIAPPAVIAALIGIMNLASHGGAAYYPNSPMSLFMTVLVGLWFGCSATVREIVDESAVYRRERQRELKRGSYIGAKLIFLAAIAFVQSVLFMAVMASMHVLIHHLLASWFLLWLITIQGGLIGLLISALAKSAEQALYLFPLVMIAELLFAGMLIPTAPIHQFFPIASLSGGQISRLDVIPPPAWFHANPPMSPLLRNTVSMVAVSRWSLEGMADLYAADAANLTGCYASQSIAPIPSDCGYSVVLLNSVALTLRPGAPEAAQSYLTAVAGALNHPPPPPPERNALPSYLSVQAIFALSMIGFIAWAMKRKESHHAG